MKITVSRIDIHFGIINGLIDVFLAMVMMVPSKSAENSHLGILGPCFFATDFFRSKNYDNRMLGVFVMMCLFS